MRILQLIVSGTLANAGRPERVKNKTKTPTILFFQVIQAHVNLILVMVEEPVRSMTIPIHVSVPKTELETDVKEGYLKMI
jgi:hypothetical protein